MTFRTLKADVIRRNILSTDYYAESVTLIDPAGDDAVVTAKPSAERTEQRQTDFGTELVVTRDFFLEMTVDPPPNTRWFVSFDSNRYAVEEVLTTASGFAVLKTKRVAAAEISRDTYRKKSP